MLRSRQREQDGMILSQRRLVPTQPKEAFCFERRAMLTSVYSGGSDWGFGEGKGGEFSAS